jgi:hypothetical protein
MALDHHFCSICWEWRKPLHNLTLVLDWSNVLIDPCDLLLECSFTVKSQVHRSSFLAQCQHSQEKQVKDGETTKKYRGRHKIDSAPGLSLKNPQQHFMSLASLSIINVNFKINNVYGVMINHVLRSEKYIP